MNEKTEAAPEDDPSLRDSAAESQDAPLNQCDRDRKADFLALSEERGPGIIREFWDFLRTNRKWWLAPIIISLLLFAILVVLSAQSAIGPWIYTFF